MLKLLQKNNSHHFQYLFMKSSSGCYLLLVIITAFSVACANPEKNSTIIEQIVSEKDTVQYIYDFMRVVINDQKLNYGYGLTLSPESNISGDGDNDSFLNGFLIDQHLNTEIEKKSSISRNDTTQIINSDSIYKLKIPELKISVVPLLSQGQSIQCLTKTDIDYILSEKERLKNFQWNNQRLGFNLKNTNNWYVFSIPSFNKDQTIAFIQIRDLCKPFLCGSSYTLIYTFKNNQWHSVKLRSAIH